MSVWAIGLAAFTVVIVLAALFVISERRGNRRALNLAIRHEQEGRYAAASYCYAFALTAGLEEGVCRAKIHELWTNHGPFDFETICQKTLSDYCGGLDRCAAGYHRVIVHEIMRIVHGSPAATAA